MCSVVGYIGKNQCRSFILEGLRRLEYRGYDSAGFACLKPEDNEFMYAKAKGKFSNLVKKISQSPIDGFVGIGHTRWATHGVASEYNAHPHFDCKKTLAIVHNGILENHRELKQNLVVAGHTFNSETDTEVIAHLLEEGFLAHGDFRQALIQTIHQLEGAFALLGIMQQQPDTMIMVRKRSPLCIGIGDGQMFVASDLLAFGDKTDKVVFLPDESFALVSADEIRLYDFAGKPLPVEVKTVDVDVHAHEKQGHAHFMLKEIYEQKGAIAKTLQFLKSIDKQVWDHLGFSVEQVQAFDSVSIIGCGTSWHAGRIAQFFFESVAQMPTKVLLASEFRYMNFFPSKKTLYIAVSQSGETADTLEAIRFISEQGLPTIAVTNVGSSSMVRETDGFLLTRAGQEVSVASTKAFSTQLTVFYWLANRLALEKGLISSEQMEMAQKDLLIVAKVLEDSIETYKLDITQQLAKQYASYKKSIFLGRHVSYPFALEAALKLKEISYVFAQGYPAGELKHGPLALIDNQTPVYVFSHQDPLLYQKILVNAQEVKARDGHVVAFAFEGQNELCELADTAFVIPRVNPLLGPLAMTGLMQFFVYQIARELNRPIDKPRNLAKSVTVE